jgi:hypothetical protein
MPRVFISYSRADLETVRELVQDLEELECQPWFDQVLTGGQRWWDTILSNIRESEFVICTLTPESLNSQACRLEAGYANKLGKPILPLRLSDTVSPDLLPPNLSELQLVDYRRQDKGALKALSRAVKSLAKAPPLPDPLPEPPPVPVSYLSTLKEKVESPSALDYKDQIALVFQLRDHFREGGPAEEIASNLRRLSRRDDFLAKVLPELNRVLDDISAGQPQAAKVSRPTAAPASFASATPPPPVAEKPAASAPAQPKKPAAEISVPAKTAARREATESGKHQLLDLKEPVGLLAELMDKSLSSGDTWILEIDPTNNFVIARSDAEGSEGLTVTANLRDGVMGAKKKELKALGWDIDNSNMLKSAIGGTALYATGGVAALAFLSKTVRDEFLGFQGTRTWPAAKSKSPGKLCAKAASELAIALEKIAPDFDVAIVRRQDEEAGA